MDDTKMVSDFNSEIDTAFRTAWQAAKGGDDNWNNLMNTYSAKPLSQEEKGYLLDSSMKIATGAFPIELRRVCDCIINKYRQQAASSQKLTDALNNFDMDSKVKEYYQKDLFKINSRFFLIRNFPYAILVVLILMIGVFDGGQFIYFKF